VTYPSRQFQQTDPPAPTGGVPGGTVRRQSVSRGFRACVVGVALVLVAAACGGGGSDNGDGGSSGGPKGEAEVSGKPTLGGSVVYGLEANTSGGWCLAEAQLVISGIQVARAIYDTLTAPGADGEIHPFLAESVTPNAEATEFTIKLRSGIKFSDGSDLTAQVVANNLDAYRGTYPARSPLLFKFVFSDVDTVSVVDPLTVKVTTKVPWPAFPWFLWGSARIGIMGQAQLDSANCPTDLVGTGPFVKENFEAGPSGKFVAKKNPNYWWKDKDGTPYPYLDQITFQANESGPDRLKSLQANDYQMIHTSGPLQIIDIRKDKNIRSIESDKYGEVSYQLLNTTKEPFSYQSARDATAYAVDRDTVNQTRNGGILKQASGPFAPGSVGFVEDTGLPTKADIEKSKAAQAEYKRQTGKDLTFTLTTGADPETLKTAELLQSMWAAAGIRVDLQSIGDQTQYINQAIGKQFEAILWRNHPGGDPDLQYVWWHCGNGSGSAPADPNAPACDNAVNFSGFNDPVLNTLMEKGRSSLNEAERKQAYEDLNREFAKQRYSLWGQWTLWAIAFQPNIHGVLGPDLPDGTAPWPGLGTGAPVQALWQAKG